MNPAMLKEKLIAILSEIQVNSGLECPPLKGTTKPVKSLPKFNSKIWPVATTMLATEIEAEIPNDVNIFFDERTKQPRSIDEISTAVCELLGGQFEGEMIAA